MLWRNDEKGRLEMINKEISTMGKKYIDLKAEITRMRDSFETKVGIVLALRWLDEHPDRAPGWTVTESELIAAVDETNHEDMNEYQKARALLVHLGHTVPDPEPSNEERLVKDLLHCEVGLSEREIDAIVDCLSDRGGR